MKELIKNILLNLIAALALYALFIFMGFLLGFASSDKYIAKTWILFFFFTSAHLTFYSILFRSKVQKGTFGISIGFIVLCWGIMALTGME